MKSEDTLQRKRKSGAQPVRTANPRKPSGPQSGQSALLQELPPAIKLGSAPVQGKAPGSSSESVPRKDRIPDLDVDAGAPLGSVRNEVESLFGDTFEDVRLHRDGRADALGVLAYTQGNHIHLDSRLGDVNTPAGKELLGHELAHVLQQRSAQVTGDAKEVIVNPALEAAADRSGAAVRRGEQVPSNLRLEQPGSSPMVRRQTPESKRIQAFNYRGPAPQGMFLIQASASHTIPLSQSVTYSVTPNAANVGPLSQYRFSWHLQNDPTTYDRYARTNPNLPRSIIGPQNATQWMLQSVYPGTHHITVTITRNGAPVQTIDFEQTVTDDGRTALHREIRGLAGQTTVDPGVREWTADEFASWLSLRTTGQTVLASWFIHNFKAQWVRAYRRVIIAAANRFDLPALLLAGVAYNEVGGDPQWIDPLAHAGRNIIPGTSSPLLTSFGNVSIQVRRAAETLGYDPAKLVGDQESLIIGSLGDARQNIFIAASHLADLRDVDFPNTPANSMTVPQMKVTATRFNRGPSLSIERIRENLSYGNSIFNRFGQLYDLLRD